MSPSVASLRGTAWDSLEASSTNSIPAGFAARNCRDLSFWHWNPGLGGGQGVGLGLLTPKISLPNFYLPHVGVGPAHSVSVPLLPVWMNVVSLIRS